MSSNQFYYVYYFRAFDSGNFKNFVSTTTYY